MNRRFLVLILVCVAVAGLSFLATGWAQSRPAATQPAATPPLWSWLQVSPGQQAEIRKDDPTFDAESAALAAELRTQRQALQALLEAPSTPDQQILDQLTRVQAVQAGLERRVTQYVLRVRHHLSSEQQLRLLGLCASGLRGGGRCSACGRGGGRGGLEATGSATAPDTCPGGGRGPGPHGFGGPGRMGGGPERGRHGQP